MYCVRWRRVHCYPLLASNGCALWRKVKTDEGWGGPRGWSVTVLNEKDRKVLSERRTDVCQGTMQLFAGRACQALLHLILSIILPHCGLPGASDSKEFACNTGDLGLTPGSGKSPGEGNGNPLQCSCLENPRNGGAWWAAVYGVAQSRTWLKRLSSSSSSSLTEA